MGVSKMKYLNVYGPEGALQKTLYHIARCACFSPEGDEAIHSAIRYGHNPYTSMLAKAKGLLEDLGHSDIAGDYIGAQDAYNTQEVSQFLENFAAEVSERSQRKADIEAKLELQVKTEEILSHMSNLDLNIDELFQVKTLKVRIGRLPKTSYTRLSYYADKGFNFTSFFNFIVYDFDGEYYWGMYFAPWSNAKDVDDIFTSLYFERVRVPDFVHGKPDDALRAIRQKEQSLRDELAGITTSAGIVTEEELLSIQNMTAWLHQMDQLHDMKRYALVFNQTFYISGFVPQESYKSFKESLSELDVVRIDEVTKKQDIPTQPPVKLKNGRFSRPYEMFTEMYGLPSYKGLDPTFIVSCIYSVLFGFMFADLGQGLVLALFGHFYMYRKRGLIIGQILARAGIFSCLFGTLFGSVFGHEHLLDPMFNAFGFAEKPFEVLRSSSILNLLLISVFIGIFTVSFCIIINIVLNLRKRKFGTALTGANGLAGLVLYLSLVFLILDGMLLRTGTAGGTLYIIFLIILPLLLIYFHEPLSELLDTGKLHVESLFDVFVGGFFELFVAMLEFLSNTVSFLRVGGSLLAHAGMMTVVMTLAGMTGGVASIAVIIVGNIFVICLEGLIVGIQSLRLNYYEVFSRFYVADGKAFQPLCLCSDTGE